MVSMKANITPTGREVALDANKVIISKTDLTGRITYVNREFMRIANYAEVEVLRRQHNLIRHPDMPRGAFKLAWDTLKSEKEFFGYVKNLTSNGDHYWVFANITPDRDASGEVVGYFSVRRKPGAAALAVIEPIYQEMREVERRAGPAAAPAASVSYLVDKLKALGTNYDRFILGL